MIRTGRFLVFLFALVSLCGAIAHAGSFKDGVPRYVTINLIPEKDAVTPGEKLAVAIQQIHQPEWHTYWKNPGDSGETTSINWVLPDGFSAGDLEYPVPQQIAYGPLMNFGFGGEVVLFTEINVPADLPQTDATLDAEISWLVCRDICVPEFTKATLVLPVATTDHPAKDTNPELFAQARAKLPQQKIWQGMVEELDQTLKLTFTPDEENLPALVAARDFFFFPEEWGVMINPAAQQVSVENNHLVILLQRDSRPLSDLRNIKGVLAFTDGDGSYRGVGLDVAIAGKPAQQNAAAAAPDNGSPASGQLVAEQVTVAQAIVLAILGGIILNLMPCVFPVLSMKALSLVKMSAKEKKHAAIHGLLYTLGVLVCFGLIAASLIALKAAGEEIGWGFQLQNPVVVLLLAYLLFVMALNLSGFFEFKGHLFSNIGHKLASHHGYTGTFFTGMLATIVATPCTAPFMGTAMGFALTQTVPVAMTIFLALGLGLALPYLALCLIPPLRKTLPRPGAWMETFRQFMAFPLYASVAWLVWVYSQQVSGSYGVMLALFGLILISFSVWISRHTPHRQPMKGAIHALSTSAIALAVLIVALSAMKPEMMTDARTQSEAVSDHLLAYSAKAYEEAIMGDKPVFAYMTASWCITCKWNERVALDTDATRQLFKEQGVTVFEGDWTNRNAEITEFLSKYGRSGVPLYVYTGARDPQSGLRPDARILPQILTPALVAEYVAEKK